MYDKAESVLVRCAKKVLGSALGYGRRGPTMYRGATKSKQIPFKRWWSLLPNATSTTLCYNRSGHDKLISPVIYARILSASSVAITGFTNAHCDHLGLICTRPKKPAASHVKEPLRKSLIEPTRLQPAPLKLGVTIRP